MSMTESATEQNLANGFAAPYEMGEVQGGNPLPIGVIQMDNGFRVRVGAERVTIGGNRWLTKSLPQKRIRLLRPVWQTECRGD